MINEINATLMTILDHMKDGQVKEAAKYSLMAGGKRLRPMMMLTAIASYGKDYRPYLRTACTLELVHTYSLIHDDLPAMDDDDLRRGRPTCHKAFDEATAILAGDALLTEAFYLLATDSALNAEMKVKCIEILSEASGDSGMIYGQQQDLYFETHDASLEQLKDTHAGKTGCLFIAPLLMAACICKPEDASSWQKVGASFGQAFQIQDDILDVIGDEAKLGKPIGSDEASHKTTYVTLLGLDGAKEMADHYFNETFANIYALQINHGLLLGLIQHLVHRDV